MNEQHFHTEKQLYQRVADGDEAAFADFYLLVKADASSYAHRVLGSREAAQEVIQESLIRLWLHRDKLVDVIHPRAWFFRIVANECTRYLAKYGFKAIDQQQPVTAEVNQTEQFISYRETQRIIAAVVTSLPPKRRTIYKLSREEGLSQPEIAAQLGVSRDYVKQALMISVKVIRERLIDEGIIIPVIVFFVH